MWLTIRGPSWTRSDTPAVRAALTSIEAEKPQRLFVTDEGFATIALHMLVGVERKSVEDDIVRQVEEIAELLAPIAAGAQPVEGPPPEMNGNSEPP